MEDELLSVLVLCTGNSARSILGEFLLRHLSQGTVFTASAGSEPTGTVHPLALDVLREDYGLAVQGASSKSIQAVETTPFDLVITVCDHARDRCPVWTTPGQRTHWGLSDPAAIAADPAIQRQGFEEVARILSLRFEAWLRLSPPERLNPQNLEDLSRRF